MNKSSVHHDNSSLSNWKYTGSLLSHNDYKAPMTAKHRDMAHSDFRFPGVNHSHGPHSVTNRSSGGRHFFRDNIADQKAISPGYAGKSYESQKWKASSVTPKRNASQGRHPNSYTNAKNSVSSTAGSTSNNHTSSSKASERVALTHGSSNNHGNATTTKEVAEKKYQTGRGSSQVSRNGTHSGVNQTKVGLFQSVNSGIPNHEPTKCSLKKNGIIYAYAANTNQGIVRNYNEDRVSIILNIMKPAHRAHESWPKCSFFGIYDGHGGAACADFLRDNLHQFVIKQEAFPWNPKEAILKGFAEAEKRFTEVALTLHGPNQHDRSGSCAIVVLIVGENCYAINVGDSRAILSSEGGDKVTPLSRDHKPMDEIEHARIAEAGGKIYQTQTPVNFGGANGRREYIVGPHRVLPGRLSVTRTFGDIEAKLAMFNGNDRVIVADPDIQSFKIAKEDDFIMLASDGIFDKVENEECIDCVWNTFSPRISVNIHQQASLGVENVMRTALNRRTLDNITVVLVAFSNFGRKVTANNQTATRGNGHVSINTEMTSNVPTSSQSPMFKYSPQTTTNATRNRQWQEDKVFTSNHQAFQSSTPKEGQRGTARNGNRGVSQRAFQF